VSVWTYVAIHLPQLAFLVFTVALGACVGSLVNVLAYRIPLGISVVSPPSRCPACGHRLTWRENIPVLGWVVLRGRCRFCKGRISVEYPIVEALMALLFGLVFFVWFILPPGAEWAGVRWGLMRQDWALNPPGHIWPSFVLVLALLGSLAAMTLIDARTFTIPLALCWVPTAAAVVIHPLHALWVQEAVGTMHVTPPGLHWMIPVPLWRDWGWVGAALGGAAGVGASNLLMAMGLIRRSFADFDEWEQSQAGSQGAGDGSDPTEAWRRYPHARREMVREAAFVAPIALLALAGWYAGSALGGEAVGPLWLRVLAGVLTGYLAGAGLVWGVRMLGSLAFGKEAMGMGDVHLLGAIGACLGWIDATLAFFAAAIVGLGWAILGAIAGGTLRRALPYGPHLAVATVLVMLGKPLLEWGLSRVLGTKINLP
jgi:leader peptidase (prepilin peptidase)/N-methyltransferase